MYSSLGEPKSALIQVAVAFFLDTSLTKRSEEM